MDTQNFTISKIKELLDKKEISTVELLEAYLARINSKNSELNCLVEVYDAQDSANYWDRQRAKGEKDLPLLAGVPIVVKDNILVKGKTASAGSKMLENYVAPYDATVVERLRAEGAIIIGRSNMDEFALGSSTENSFYGPTKNPWDISRVPGGSSGGSAAAVAAGFVPVAIGSDTGGSIRQPSALCGVVGIKPTYGRVSRYGLIAMSSSLDQIGSMARTVEDAALIMQVMEGYDSHDATSIADFSSAPAELIQSSVKGLKIGVPREYFIEGMDKGVKKSVMDAIHLLEENGAEIHEISLPHTQYALAAYYLIMPSEVSSNLARFDGVRYGYAAGEADDMKSFYAKSRAEGFGAEAKRRIMLGCHALSSGYYDAYYKKALQIRTMIRQDFDEALKEVDCIVTPTTPTVAWKLGEKFNDPISMYLSDIYTVSINLAALPAISVPCGFLGGLPVGLQVIGRSFGEATILQVGKAYQSLTDWHNKPAKL